MLRRRTSSFGTASWLIVAGCTMAATSGTASAQPCPPGPPAQIVITSPSRMVNDKSLTIKAELLDEYGRTAWRIWDKVGFVSLRRLSDQAVVPISIVVFDTFDGPPPADSIRFYNGMGCATIVLDGGGTVEAGDAELAVTVAGSVGGVPYSLTTTKVVTILDDPVYTNLAGTLSGAALNWGPDDGVIHVTGNVTVNVGSTLSIEPGTLVMVDRGSPGPPGYGTLLTIQGTVQAVGTQADPIFFFPTNQVPALTLMESCAAPAYNPDSWRGIFHSGGGTSQYEYVILTGAGNGGLEGHARPPIFRFQGAHSFVMNKCVGAFNNGKFIYTDGTGDYRVSDSLISQCGHGIEFNGPGDYALLVENTWFTRNGRGPQACDYDGDCLNIRGSNPAFQGGKHVTGCIFVDSGDDAIDVQSSSPFIENCIFWHMDDKAVSMEGEEVLPVLTNLLAFDVMSAFDGHHLAESGPGSLFEVSYSTLEARAARAFQRIVPGTTVDQCIVWPNQLPTCDEAVVNYSNVGDGSDLRCGAGNFTTDPQFVSVAAHDYQLQLTSPARTAGPSDEQIGWLGFPQPFCFCRGDSDGDTFVDLADYIDFEACLDAPQRGPGSGCGCFDFDGDGDVDLLDFAGFQRTFGG